MPDQPEHFWSLGCRLHVTVHVDYSPLILAVHLLPTITNLLRPGGVRAVVAESLLLKHQLVISSRVRRRAPNLNSFDRFVLGPALCRFLPWRG